MSNVRIDPNIFKFVDGETDIGKFNWMERYIIIHSLLYYEFNISLISDYTFDIRCKTLYDNIVQHPKIFEVSKYYDIFKDFNGCSGFDIPEKLKNHEDYRMLIRTAISIGWKGEPSQCIKKIIGGIKK